MDTDKAYLLGLIVGGGIFGNAEDVFKIRLPYKKWGSYLENPQRAGQISRDIFQQVGQMFRAVYGISVQFDTTPGGIWNILCEGDYSQMKDDLARYGISCEGEIRGNADIGRIAADLIDDNLKRRFVAGLADTIGSMTPTHRRFTAEHQTLSFEIKGYNFKSVCDLCRLLYSINCIPDQVTWNHPNIHCASDPYYNQWHKGFKLRILLDQYARFGAFAFRTKAEAQDENRRLQQQTHTAVRCETRPINISPSTVHPAEHDERLPDEIRGGHYIHSRHFCAVLGCEHAPYDQLCPCFAHLGEYINPFPILSKDSMPRIENIIASDPLLDGRTYTTDRVAIAPLLTLSKRDPHALIYGTTERNGYPILKVLQAVAYVIADDKVNGKRPKGSYREIIQRCLTSHPRLRVEIRKPDLLTPIVVLGNGRGALVGPVNPDVYGRLVSRDPHNEYKLLVRRITEEDLRNANGEE